jgi:PadR family transcriptional regulator PadR
MSTPPLSSLQFLVLQVIGAVERSGKEVREKLAQHGHRKSLPSFYQLMARLEDSGFVTGSYRLINIEGQIVKERWYKISAAGIRACETTKGFYSGPATIAKGGPALA